MDMKVVKNQVGLESLKTNEAKKYLCSSSLFCETNEVIILHGKEQYRLRVTRQNKLILTK